jgi:tripartite-type tricarboxylate transporter receptor subunit TctC
MKSTSVIRAELMERYCVARRTKIAYSSVIKRIRSSASSFVIRSLRAIAVTALALVSAHAPAQNQDKGIMTLVVGYSAGGPFDVLARLVGQEFTRQFGQTVIVENKPGAGGALAGELVARAKPDGQYLYFAAGPTLTISPHILRAANNFNPQSLTPIIMVSEYSNALIVNTNSNIKTVGDLIKIGKSQPDQVTYGSGGIGASNHLAAELLASATGARFSHVPYRGSGPALQDVLGNRLGFMFIDVSAVAPQLATGKIRALAVTSKTRNQSIPDVPTMIEVGVPAATMAVWIGILGPKDMPADTVRKLQAAFRSVLKDPALEQKIRERGHESLAASNEDMAARIKGDYAMWGKVVRDAKIEPQ